MNINTFKRKQGIKSDTFTDKLIEDGSYLIQEINHLVKCRKELKITQEEMSWACKVSLPTIKRFESLKVDSLTLFLNYKHICS